MNEEEQKRLDEISTVGGMPPAGAAPAAGDQASSVFDAPPPSTRVFSSDISDIELDRLNEISVAGEGGPPQTSSGPTFGEEAFDFYRGTGAGVTETSPFVIGMVKGARAGVPYLLSPYLPPYIRIGAPVVGGILGAATGLIAGQQLSENFIGGPTTEGTRPAFESGRTLGSSIAFAPASFFLPTTTAGSIGKFVNAIREGAIKNPKSYLLGETLYGGGAATGAYLAESYSPGDPYMRLAAETTLGIKFFNPLMAIPYITSGGYKRLKELASLTTKKGRAVAAERGSVRAQDEVTRRLLEIFEKNKEDVLALSKALDAELPGAPLVTYPSPGQPGVQFTGPSSAQKTGSLTLSEIEAALSALDPAFSVELQRQGEKSLAAFSNVLDRLTDVGDPTSLRVAAEMREAWFTAAITARLERGNLRAADRISKITKDTPEARIEIGNIGKDEAVKALTGGRAAESFYWEYALRDILRPAGKTTVRSPAGEATRVVPRPKRLSIENTVRQYLDRASTNGPGLADMNALVPSELRVIMGKLGITDAHVNRYHEGKGTGYYSNTGLVDPNFLPGTKTLEKVPPISLLNYRSSLLKLGRQASSTGNTDAASFYNEMAEAMLEDLSKLDSPALDKAREFSRALNDVFTRTFAGQMLGKKATGAARYPAETLVQKAFSGASDVTILRMQEIENAVAFMRDRLKKAADEATPAIPGMISPRVQKEADMLQELAQVSTDGVVSIQDAQNRVLRLLASKALFTDGSGRTRLNVNKLNNFIGDYKPLLDAMNITPDLTNATQAENLLRGVIERESALNKSVRQQMAFSKILAFESPTSAVSAALSPSNPNQMRSFERLARFARRSGYDATQGLKSSIYDYAFTEASGNRGVLDPQTFKDLFFKPAFKDKPTLATILLRQGVMSLDEVKNIRILSDRMLQIEKAMKNKRGLEDFLQGADILSDFVMRSAGSQIGQQTGGTLIAASAGSKAVRSIFEKMPNMMVRKTFQRAVQDPAFMAALLRRSVSEKERMVFARSLHSYLLASGLTFATNENTFPEEGQVRQTLERNPPPRPSPPRPTSVAPTTRGVPGLPSGGGAPPAKGGTPPTTQSRMMLQQLFPNDAITGAAGMPPMPG